MRKTDIAVVMLVAVVLSGCVGGNKTSNNQETPKSEPREELGYKTMAQLVASGKPVHCKWTDTSQEMKGATGDIYVDGKRFFSRIESMIEGKQLVASVYGDGEWVYSWTSMDQKRGMKFKAEKESAAVSPTQGEVEWNREYDYKCERWSVDSKLFATPEGMSFVDSSTIMKETAKPTGSVQKPSGVDCSVCDQVPEGESRAACKTGLGCK